MRAPRTSSKILTTLFGILVIYCSSCGRDPVWLPELRNLIEKSNREFEAAMPLLDQDASPESAYIALRQLDKSTDEIVDELDAFLEKYPGIAKEKISVAFHLRKQLDRLGKNLKQGFAAGIVWDKRIGHEKEFRQLAASIDKKTRKVNRLLSAVMEPEYD